MFHMHKYHWCKRRDIISLPLFLSQLQLIRYYAVGETAFVDRAARHDVVWPAFIWTFLINEHVQKAIDAQAWLLIAFCTCSVISPSSFRDSTDGS
jgi:hypothetical protein